MKNNKSSSAKKIFFLLSFILMLISFGCNSSINKGKILNIEVKPIKIDVWKNLMPGKETSFYISGKVNITNKEKRIIKNILLRTIIISQDNKSVYEPHILFNPLSGSNLIQPHKEAKFDFKSSLNLKMMNGFNIDNPVSVQLIFTSSGKNYNLKIEKIKIQKIY